MILRTVLLFLAFGAATADAETCDIPAEYMSTFGSVVYGLSEAAKRKQDPLTTVGSIIVSVSLDEACISFFESGELRQEALDQCFGYVETSFTRDKAHALAAAITEMIPNSIIAVGWAVTDTPTELGLPVVAGFLQVSGYPKVYIDQSKDPAETCGDSDGV